MKDFIEKFGIKEIKEFLKFFFLLGKAMVDSYEDKKVTWTDSFKFVPVLSAGPKAFNGANLLDDEFADISDAEKTELIEFAREFYPEYDDTALWELVQDTIFLAMDYFRFFKRKKNKADVLRAVA